MGSAAACRDCLRTGLQRIFQQFNDPAILLVDPALHEPLTKSYLGEPDQGFQELHLPVALCRPLGPEVLERSVHAQLQQHSHVVFLVRGQPQCAQLVAQCILEIKRCASYDAYMISRLILHCQTAGHQDSCLTTYH